MSNKNLSGYQFYLNSEDFYFASESISRRILNNQNILTLDEFFSEVSKLYKGKINPNFSHGLIFDSDYNLLVVPEINQLQHPVKTDNVIKYKPIDGTLITLSVVNDRLLMSTKNSWDITNTSDLYTTTYGEAFLQTFAEETDDESCKEDPKKYFEELIESSGGNSLTFYFSNPNFHLLAKEHRIYSFNTFDKDFPLDPLDESADNSIEGWIEYYPELNCFYENYSEKRMKLTKVLYNNRYKYCWSETNELNLLNCLLHYMINADNNTRFYVRDNQLFNDTATVYYVFLTGVFKAVKNQSMKSSSIYKIDIPQRLLDGLRANKINRFTYHYTDFWLDVIHKSFIVEKQKSSPNTLSRFNKMILNF